MTKKYYAVEFNIGAAVWAEDEGDAYNKAKQRILSAPASGLNERLWSYDDCVTEVEESYIDWDDPDAPTPDEVAS